MEKQYLSTLEKLKESEERLSVIVSNLPLGLVLIDENRKVVLVNKMFCEMFTLPMSPDELIGYNCTDVSEYAKDLFVDPENFIETTYAIIDKQAFHTDEDLLLKDGRVIQRTFIPVLREDQFKGYIWKFKDFTSRKQNENALLLREQKYRNIIANMNMGLVEVDLEGKIVFANQSFCNITGYELSEILGKGGEVIFGSSSDLSTLKEKMDKRKKGMSDTYEMPVTNKRGELRWLLISGAPKYDDNGEIIGSIGIHLDNTEHKMRELELREARKLAEESSKAKDAFLANMSHEIRTPLNGIIGLVRELSKETTAPKQQTYLRKADIAAKHLLSIINNILDISKVEAGMLDIDHTPFSLRNIVSDTVDIISNSLKDKLLDYEVFVSDEIQEAFVGDPTRIRQIMLNILSNAVKFTEKGKIRLECTSKGVNRQSQLINIHISDTGVGMEKDYLKKLFSKFSQEDKTITRRYGGTGLGMAITRELIELMSGTIDVKSEKGIGTEVSIFLPLKLATGSELQIESTADNTERLLGAKVLLVEDNELNRLVAENALQHYKVQITSAENGKEALDILKKESFDLILMDLQMPVLDGIEATKIIRRELKIATPIIAFTANAFEKDVNNCLAIGMNDYIIKPFEEDVFLKTILKYIKKGTSAPEAFINPDQVSSANMHSQEKSKRYSLDRLEEISRGDSLFILKMIQLFKEQAEVTIVQMKDAHQKNDFKTISSLAHRIKPSIDNLKIEEIQEDIRQLESLNSETSTYIEIDALLQRIEECLSEIVKELNYAPKNGNISI